VKVADGLPSLFAACLARCLRQLMRAVFLSNSPLRQPAHQEEGEPWMSHQTHIQEVHMDSRPCPVLVHAWRFVLAFLWLFHEQIEFTK